eukprot:UN04177
MSWIGSWIDTSRDDEQYANALKTHNYFAWDIYYDHQIESIDKQINELNRQIQQVNTMSLTATAAISPYQRQIHSFSASNDLVSLCMAQNMNGIVKGYSNGIKKNSTEIRQIQNKLKQFEDRKRKLIQMNRNILQHKETWRQSQLSQQLQLRIQSQQQSHNNNNDVNHDPHNIQSMQDKINQNQNMIMNLQSHILQNNNDSY